MKTKKVFYDVYNRELTVIGYYKPHLQAERWRGELWWRATYYRNLENFTCIGRTKRDALDIIRHMAGPDKPAAVASPLQPRTRSG